MTARTGDDTVIANQMRATKLNASMLDQYRRGLIADTAVVALPASQAMCGKCKVPEGSNNVGRVIAYKKEGPISAIGPSVWGLRRFVHYGFRHWSRPPAFVSRTRST